MSDQLALDFDHREDRIDREFAAFHAANPHVMAELIRLTREALDAGASRVGMGMLFEVLRYGHLRTTGEPFKLNNNLRSRYARRIMAAHPDLDGVYEVRELRPPVPRSLAAA